MATTNMRAREILSDRIIRSGGNPAGQAIVEEWGLVGLGAGKATEISRRLYAFAVGYPHTKHLSAAMAVLQMMDRDKSLYAAFVESRVVARDFLAAGFPIAAMSYKSAKPSLWVGYDDTGSRRVLSTDGWIPGDDVYEHEMIALSETPSWNTRL